MTLRQKINWWLGIISSIGGMASIVVGFGIPRFGIPKLVDQDLAKAIIAFWILIPPLYFWFEWTFLRRDAELTDPLITDGIKALS
jgi:hypothetical protein